MTASLAHRGPDADGFPATARSGTRPPPAVGDRPRRQPAADVERRRPRGGRLQRRDLQLPRAARRARGRGGRFAHRTATPRCSSPGWQRGARASSTGCAACSRSRCGTRATRTLFAARDHLGVKPFHYAWDGATLVFGSELKAVLRASGRAAREIDVDALRLYLECQFIPAPRTGLPRRAQAAARPRADARGGQARDAAATGGPTTRASSRCRAARRPTRSTASLRASIEGMLVADVPLGAFVSGGVDSGLIAAMMTDLTGGPIDTFNIGFEGSVVGSEHVEAARVAAHIGSRHHALMLSPDHVLDAFDRWIDVFDEPFADQAALPTMLLAEFARRDVTVVLTGEGADEVFGGLLATTASACARSVLTRWLGAPGSPLPALVRALPPRSRKDRLLRRRRAARASLPHDPQRVRRRCCSRAASPTASTSAPRRAIADSAAALYAAVRFAVVPRPPAARRHAAVAARRPAHQGRPRDDDALAGGAGPLPRPPVRRVLRAARAGVQDPTAARTSGC